ncbi:MAG: methyltransferase domain-containing protein [Cyanobacteria bacterium SZAS LIN-3]|nr:methyltransferase domain-containing protein [Cyanobacteria bacterium SZAS LIN-3]
MDSQQLASSSLRYDYKLSGFDETSHYGRLLGRVGRGKRVLELGSSTGYLTSAMTEHFDCTVVGVEVDADAAAAARARGHEVLLLDLDKSDLTKELAGRKFDVVLCADVLEHLRDPQQTIKQLVELLAEDGYVICSIPHVGHADIRLAMLSGKLPYRPMGLLDHTHMKFFTRALVEELFESSGMLVEKVERNRWQATKTEVQGRLPSHLKVVGDLIAADPEAETYQFIVKARPYKAGEKLSARAAAEATSEGLARVDVVVVDQDSHVADDLYQKYLSTLNYPSELIRFWFVSGPNALALADKPKGEPAAYADNDFRTFRFISMGSGDAQMSRTQISYRNELSQAEIASARVDGGVNFASTLSQVARGSDAKYLFILTPDTLPGANCLTALVRAAEKEGAAKTSTEFGSGLSALIVARPEVRLPGRPVPYGPENLLSWHEFSCMLVPRDFLIEAKSADPNLWTSQAQAVDMCFRAWACGRKVIECPEANYFSNGQLAVFGDYDITVADGLRLRRRWGSLRNLLAFAKYSAGRCGGPFVWLKTANHVVAALAIETPLRAALPEVARGLVGFGGPGASEIGHTAAEIG